MKVNGRHVDWGTCPLLLLLLLLIACTEPFILALYCTDSKREREKERARFRKTLSLSLSFFFIWFGGERVSVKEVIDI